MGENSFMMWHSILLQKIYFKINQCLPVIHVDLNSFLDHIQHINYCLVKLNTPYFDDNFPFTYTVGKDLDVIVNASYFNTIRLITIEYFMKYHGKYLLKIKVIDDVYGCRIRIQRLGILHFQIDISAAIDELTSTFVDEMLSNRIAMQNYYVSASKYELIIRLLEVVNYPHKTHHLNYIKEFNDYFDIKLLESEYIKNEAQAIKNEYQKIFSL